MERQSSGFPPRRAEGILTTRRQPVQWASGQPFRILSLDGGGIKGIFPTAVLARLERAYLEEKSAGDYFDLIAGTSISGIFALGLGAGMTAGEILQMYLEEGPCPIMAVLGPSPGQLTQKRNTRWHRPSTLKPVSMATIPAGRYTSCGRHPRAFSLSTKLAQLHTQRPRPQTPRYSIPPLSKGGKFVLSALLGSKSRVI